MQKPSLGLQNSTVLGERYRIISVLGSGGMSTVYLAEDMRLPGKCWAVKETCLDGSNAYASLAEADMLIRLQHPNLPEIVDYYPPNEQGFSYLIMDYIEGETLLQRFERQGRRMPGGQLVGYVLQLCDLFHYLHTCLPVPIVYRDLKPSNLMIDLQERVRLIDFGIARSFKAGQAADTVPIGTVGFAAPEQFEGRQTDARTDLYALGALMYFVLSGGQYYHTARKHLGELDAGISTSLTCLVEKLLQAEPDARCQSAAEVRGELQRVLAEQRAQPGAAVHRSTGMAEPKREPRVVAVGGLYAGAGATFAALSVARALHAMGIPHAVLEPPGQQPELYALLFGEKHAPAGYRCYNDAAARGRHAADVWLDGCTLWLPSNQASYGTVEAANGDVGLTSVAESTSSLYAFTSSRAWGVKGASAFNQDQAVRAAFGEGTAAYFSTTETEQSGWLQFIQGLDRPVIVIDTGSDWQNPAVRELMAIAKDIVYVVEPLLHKLESGTARRNLKLLEELRLSGKSIHAIANKTLESKQTGHWLKVLPEPPVCLLPSIDFSFIADASWQGTLVQDGSSVQPLLLRALQPWLHSLLLSGSPVIGKEPGRGSRRMLQKLWKNG